METNTAIVPPSNISNVTHNHHVQSNLQNHHHKILPSNSILIIIIPIISIFLILTICFLIIMLLRRIKSTKSGSNNTKSNCSINNEDLNFIALGTLSFNTSPDVKTGCLYGGYLPRVPTIKPKGVQVFTYRELELATDKFSEANVIGNGGFGVVYRGVLNDGSVAAIKMLHRDGKQGERAFRIEVDLLSRYASSGKLTTKSDVYSYGVVLLELLTGRVPVDTKRPPGEHVLVSWALPRLTNREKVVEMVDPAIQGQYSKKDLIQVAAIAAMCVQPEADYRPLMTDVVQSLIPLVKNLSSISLSSSSKYMSQTSPKS
ncbi:Serine-threonine/tyrosine-protein kinase, catalytic domain [Dillenia turbinata]|uniref:Serine-threonine/tyrosine-protein kinase, catalytic domain n=1 Tax=Dillenia turbinata TaxID=194707 RepID=A0AAN8YX47_9MAGN